MGVYDLFIQFLESGWHLVEHAKLFFLHEHLLVLHFPLHWQILKSFFALNPEHSLAALVKATFSNVDSCVLSTSGSDMFLMSIKSM